MIVLSMSPVIIAKWLMPLNLIAFVHSDKNVNIYVKEEVNEPSILYLFYKMFDSKVGTRSLYGN